jgi:ankyrin repeat protein
MPAHMEIIEKLQGAIRGNDIDSFRQICSEETARNWIRQGGLDREGTCDEAKGFVQKTLLHFACEKGRDTFVRELLEIKASPNVQARGLPGKVSRDTPLHLAVLHQQESCVGHLLAYKAIISSILVVLFSCSDPFHHGVFFRPIKGTRSRTALEKLLCILQQF